MHDKKNPLQTIPICFCYGTLFFDTRNPQRIVECWMFFESTHTSSLYSNIFKIWYIESCQNKSQIKNHFNLASSLKTMSTYKPELYLSTMWGPSQRVLNFFSDQTPHKLLSIVVVLTYMYEVCMKVCHGTMMINDLCI